MQNIHIEQEENIYTVSRLNNDVRFLLEDAFSVIWVEGEISNFAAPNSGHWYFSLKDSKAQVRCAMFRLQQRHLNFVPQNGLHVLIKARVSLYENRGEFQLIAESMEEIGEGRLRRAYEFLKKKLESAGLFDPSHKKSLPAFPTQIGIITSATGAAIYDILTVLKRRHPCVSIIIYPTLVQGKTAAPAIVKAIQIANQRQECDVLILARGGGSLEDLWPFNEEEVAMAIYQSTIPIISGIGHEVDFTIADFVADRRAPTPSAAAEIAAPDCAELSQILIRYSHETTRQIQNKFHQVKQHIGWVQKHLSQQHPKRRLSEKIQQLDFYELNLIQLITCFINNKNLSLKKIETKLNDHLPLPLIHQLQHRIQLNQHEIQNKLHKHFNKQQHYLIQLAATLDALSPLATLKRGYAIVTHHKMENINSDHLPDENESVIIRSASEVKVGDKIQIRLLQDILDCIVSGSNTINKNL